MKHPRLIFVMCLLGVGSLILPVPAQSPTGRFVGTYSRLTMGASRPQKTVLVLNKDLSCTLTFSEPTRKDLTPDVNQGTWGVKGKAVRVEVAISGTAKKETFVFELIGDLLYATQYDRSNYGETFELVREKECDKKALLEGGRVRPAVSQSAWISAL